MKESARNPRLSKWFNSISQRAPLQVPGRLPQGSGQPPSRFYCRKTKKVRRATEAKQHWCWRERQFAVIRQRSLGARLAQVGLVARKPVRIWFIDAQRLIHETRGVFPGHAVPHQSLRNKALAFWPGKLTQTIGTIDAPPLCRTVAELISKAECIHIISRVRPAHNRAIGLPAKAGKISKARRVGNLAPMIIEPFQSGGDTAVVGVKEEHKLPRSFRHAQIHGRMLAAIWLPQISNRKYWFPRRHLFPGSIGTAVVHDDPFEITKSLGAETFVDSPQRMGPIVSWSQDSESHMN